MNPSCGAQDQLNINELRVRKTRHINLKNVLGDRGSNLIPFVPDFHYPVPDFYYPIPDRYYPVPDLYYPVPDLYCQIPDLYYQVPDLCYEIPDLYYSLSEIYYLVHSVRFRHCRARPPMWSISISRKR